MPCFKRCAMVELDAAGSREAAVAGLRNGDAIRLSAWCAAHVFKQLPNGAFVIKGWVPVEHELLKWPTLEMRHAQRMEEVMAGAVEAAPP